MRIIFSRDISPSCEYCSNSRRLSTSNEMLCPKQGVVSSGHFCKQFKYDPLKRRPKRKTSAEIFSSKDFSLK